MPNFFSTYWRFPQFNFIPLRVHNPAKFPILFVHRFANYSYAHIYENHLEAARLQISRQPKILPWVEVISKPGEAFDILKWDPAEVALVDYNPHPAIKMEVAV